MRPPAEFLRQLKKLDPTLEVEFDRNIERWVLWRRLGGRMTPEAKKNGFPALEAVNVGTGLWRLQPFRLLIGPIVGPGDCYMPLNSAVISRLRALDAFHKGRVRDGSLAVRAQQRSENDKYEQRIEDRKADAKRFIRRAGNLKIDLGART